MKEGKRKKVLLTINRATTDTTSHPKRKMMTQILMTW
jgi:hypothetical protein